MKNNLVGETIKKVNFSGEVKSVLLFDEKTKVGSGWKEAGTRSGFRGDVWAGHCTYYLLIFGHEIGLIIW